MDGWLLRFDVVGMSRVAVRSVGQVPDASLNFGWICILEGGARREDLAETLQSAPVLITGALRITVTQPSHDASPCDPDLRAIIRLDQPIQSLPRNP